MRSFRARRLTRRSNYITSWLRNLIADLIAANKEIDKEVNTISTKNRTCQRKHDAAVRKMEARKDKTVKANTATANELKRLQEQNGVTLAKFQELLG